MLVTKMEHIGDINNFLEQQAYKHILTYLDRGHYLIRTNVSSRGKPETLPTYLQIH